MNRDDIIRMAKEAHVKCYPAWAHGSNIEAIERFFHMAQAAERERLAKVFDERDKGTGFYEPHEPAEIIRARGKS